MKLLVIFSVVILSVTAIPAPSEDDEGFLTGSTCNDAQDCYIFDDTSKGLQLACWYNVHQCKCQNTIRSDYHLEWKDGKCRMSKYGPCGKNGNLEVACLDGFECKDDKCQDPKSPDGSTPKSGPFIFDKKCSDGCNFSEDLNLDCSRDQDKCACRKVYIADSRGTTWDIRSFDGDKKCSVGKFGPCGKKDGLEIECHGEGISCVDGTCLNSNHPISELNESCESTKNCKSGLLCSRDRTCIEPKSLTQGKRCKNEDECLEGLKCKRPPNSSPWNDPFCGTDADFEKPTPVAPTN